MWQLVTITQRWILGNQKLLMCTETLNRPCTRQILKQPMMYFHQPNAGQIQYKNRFFSYMPGTSRFLSPRAFVNSLSKDVDLLSLLSWNIARPDATGRPSLLPNQFPKSPPVCRPKWCWWCRSCLLPDLPTKVLLYQPECVPLDLLRPPGKASSKMRPDYAVYCSQNRCTFSVFRCVKWMTQGQP